MQRFKTHPHVKKYFENGKCISYGARSLIEGGLFALPKLTFPGGVIVGDSAGFLNVTKSKIKKIKEK
jgi:electron-transferring-flavoprotein dehydrogenase